MWRKIKEASEQSSEMLFLSMWSSISALEEKQNNGQQEDEYIEPVVEHQIPERAQLAELICTHVAGITLQDIVARRIHSTGLMVVLCHSREVPRRYRLRVALRNHLSSRRNRPRPIPSHSLLSLPRASALSVVATNRRVMRSGWALFAALRR